MDIKGLSLAQRIIVPGFFIVIFIIDKCGWLLFTLFIHLLFHGLSFYYSYYNSFSFQCY
ncbi:hypothetical protein BDF14DRAFT_1859538 [Spinellus fusiger]|nr:hypothetical protein BDF14DRAFT_1859538 [Spinellus fusiger]